MLEKTVEQQVSKYAVEHRCLVLKLNVMGRIGWPDRLYIYAGKLLFIEFKRPSETPRKVQAHVHRLIRLHGFPVEVIDTAEEGKAALRLHLLGM